MSSVLWIYFSNVGWLRACSCISKLQAVDENYCVYEMRSL